MSKINGWAVIVVTLGAVIILLGAANWLAPVSTGWETTRGVWRVLFAPLMFLMPLAWLGLPVLAIACMIRWLASGSTHGFSAPANLNALACSNCGRSLRADWQLCPHCGERANLQATREPFEKFEEKLT